MLGVTLARHCLDRGVAALEALSDGDAEAAARDLRAAGSAWSCVRSACPRMSRRSGRPSLDVLHRLGG